MKRENIAILLFVANLDSRLTQTELATDLLPHVRVWVVRLAEQALQLVELLLREVRPTPTRLRLRAVVCRSDVIVARVVRSWGR